MARAPIIVVAIALAASAGLTGGAAGPAQVTEKAGERLVTVPVTVHPHNDRARQMASDLRADAFAVREDDREQLVISVDGPDKTPVILALLIQDDLISQVNLELDRLRRFIRSLPQGSRVMTGYLTVGDVTVTQAFTPDLAAAAASLRILRGRSAAPFNPYVGVVNILRRFGEQPAGRRVVLMVSDGLDISRGFSPESVLRSIDLERAISEAQRLGVAVFGVYAPSTGLTSVSRFAANYGQAALNRLADETGGLGFQSGFTFVTFDPYLREFRTLLGRMWLLSYRTTSTSSGFRKIKVTTPLDLHIHYPAGYRAQR
ncbi:MAG TPA: hypothetical protein VI485_03055 [Vicinamibacterales bacterium]|nr:hypothetical protein [Vicinamibacterales bacterium]